MTERADLADLAQRLLARSAERRVLVALAGPPGAGKSTVSARLAETIDTRAPGRVAVVPMDGFHLDDPLLQTRGLRARKGAPDTFDVGGLAACLRRLRARDEEEVLVPLFDRTIEIARAGALAVPRSIDIVLVEGNYLLLDRDPWRALAPRFDVTVYLRCSEEDLVRRLSRRWLDHGYDADTARAKVDSNDLPNGRLVAAHSRPADVEIPN